MVSSLAVATVKKRRCPELMPRGGRHGCRHDSAHLRLCAIDTGDIGLLVSLGGEPVEIILGSEATTAFTSRRIRWAGIIFECSSEFRWWCETEGRSKGSKFPARLRGIIERLRTAPSRSVKLQWPMTVSEPPIY